MMARSLFQILPVRVQASLYRRFICPHRQNFGRWFEDAPLKWAPSVRMKLSPGDSFHGDIAFCGIYEAEETALIHQLAVEKGGLLVDVGANYGYYSLLWCAAREGNRALAIEASPANVQALRENIVRNGMDGRIQVLECAASNREGLVRFEIGSDDETGWGGIASNGAAATLEVSSCRLDEVVREPVALLKVDCEGADAWVIEGAQGLLQKNWMANVVFEENLWRQERLGIVAGSAARRLSEAGFVVRPLGNGEVNFVASKQDSAATVTR